MRILTGKEREAAMLATLTAKATVPTQDQWSDAWEERHKQFIRSGKLEDLRPVYVDRGYHRRDGEYVANESPEWRWHLRYRILDCAASYLRGNETIMELGCGTGYNLACLNQSVYGAKLIGTDWDETVATRMPDLKMGIDGHYLDMSCPIASEPEGNVGIMTIGSMEMIGSWWNYVLEWFMRFKPSVVFHSEPIYELYDQSNLFDYVAANYHERRNYLRGYYPELQRLEQQGRIEILEVTRMPGSCHHDGSTILVWRPL